MRNEKWEMGDGGRSSEAPFVSTLLRSFGRGARCVSSGTLTIFIDFSGLKPGVTHKSVLSGDGIPSPYHHTTLTASWLL